MLLDFNLGVSRLDFAYDPSNFTYSKAYGVAPTEELLIRYMVGGGTSANVPANTITSKNNLILTRGVAGDTTFNNLRPASGGRDGDTVDELRQNSVRAFNEQGRAVTLQDYTVRTLSLPAKFGSIAKVYVTQDKRSNTNLTDAIIDNKPQ